MRPAPTLTPHPTSPAGPGPIGPRSASSTGTGVYDLGLEVGTGGGGAGGPMGPGGAPPGLSPLQAPGPLPAAGGPAAGGPVGRPGASQSFFEQQSFFSSADLMADDPLEHDQE